MGTSAVITKRERRASFGTPPGLEDFEAVWKATAYTPGAATLPDLTGNGHDLDVQQGTTNEPSFLDYAGVLYSYLPGVAGNSFSTPDSTALSITGDIDLRAALALDDWTPSAKQAVLAKGSTATGDYQFLVLADGTLRLGWHDGSSALTEDSTAAPSVTDGDLLLVRVTMDVDDGGGNRDITFFTKTSTEADAHADLLDDTGWTQLGSVVTTAATTSIRDSADDLFIGRLGDDTASLTGKTYAVVVKDGIDGTTVASPDFTDTAQWSEPYSTGDDAQGNTWTANRSSSGRKLAFVDQPVFLFADDDFMEAADAAGLDFGSDDDFTVLLALRSYDIVGGRRVLSKRSTGAGYEIFSDGGMPINMRASDGTDTVDSSTNAVPSHGAIATVAMRRDGAAWDTLLNGVVVSSDDASAVDSLENGLSLLIGARADQSLFAGFEFVGAGIVRRALTDADIVTAGEELKKA